MCSPWPRLSLPFVVALLALAGCATAPVVPRQAGAAADWLGGTPRVLVHLDATRVDAWKQVTQANEGLKAVGDRTRGVWLGFDLNHLDDLKTAADTVHIVLEGDFPRGAVGWALDWNSAWAKGPVPGVWTNAKLALSVTVPQDNLVTARRRDPAPVVPLAGALRDLDPRTVEAAAVWISFWNPGEALFGPVGAKLLPVDRLDVVLEKTDAGLEGPVVLRFADPRAAQAATVLLKMAAPQVRARFGQDLEWSVEGSTIVGSTLRLKNRDLTALALPLVAEAPLQGGNP